VAEALELTGSLSLSALTTALGHLVARHGALRTRFAAAADDTPVQLVDPPAPRLPGLPVADLSALTSADATTAREALSTAAARRPFDLATGPLWRPWLLRLGPERHHLVATMHHIVTDGWSMGILARELGVVYGAAAEGVPARLSPPEIAFTDHARRQRTRLEETGTELLTWWRAHMEDAPPVLELPTDRPRPAGVHHEARRASVVLSGAAAQVVDRLSGGGVTPFMVLLAAWSMLLSRLAGNRLPLPEVTVGTPLAHRPTPDLEGVVGFFVNTLPLRLRLPEVGASFTDVVTRARDEAVAAFAHQDASFADLVEALAPWRDLATPPIFQAFFVLQNAPLEPLELSRLTLERRQVFTGTGPFDLSLHLTPEGSGYRGFVEGRSVLFDPTTLSRWAEHLEILLTAAAEADAATPWSELPLLTPAQRHQMVHGVIDLPEAPGAFGPDPYRWPRLEDRFRTSVAATPDRVAAEHDGVFVSYETLHRRAEELAGRLRADGVGAEQVVGVRLERGIDQLTAVLALLYADGVLLPLDTGYPEERLRFMIADARVRRVLRDDGGDLEGLDRPDTWRTPSLPRSAVRDNLAYLIYTSGTTGVPKGIAMTHRAITHLLSWQDRRLAQGTDDGVPPPGRALQFAPINFDVYFQETFGTWGAGGTVVLVDDDLRRDPELLWRFLLDHRVERIFVPFVALAQLAEVAGERVTEGFADDAALSYIATAGEQLRVTDKVRRWFAVTGSRLDNQYGPSEAHVVTGNEMEGGPELWVSLPGIGRPVGGLGVHVVDHALAPRPPGTVGEVVVSGPQLARGYVHAPARTAEVFTPAGDLLSGPGARCYRTGDLARVGARGEMTFLGRLDHQVKIRGHRVEPSEVEAALAALPEVREAAVTVRGDAEGRDQRLIGYVLPEAGTGWSDDPEAARELSRRLITQLGEVLPPYLVPSVLVPLDALPLSPSGKVDRRALPDPPAAGTAAVEPPVGPVEELVAGVYEELLERSNVGRRDDFFDLGGHSLAAARAASRLSRRLGVDVPVQDLFTHPMVTALAAALEARRAGGGKTELPPLEPAPGYDRPSFAQERLWWLDRSADTSAARAAYNMPGAFRLTGDLPPRVLAECLERLGTRHPVLAGRFEELAGRSRWVAGPMPETRALVDLSGLSPADAESRAERLAAAETGRPFDLGNGPLTRARLLRVGPAEHRLLVTFHHAVADGWTLDLVVRDVAVLYEAARAGRPAPSTVARHDYRDYAAWQRRLAEAGAFDADLDFWAETLDGAEPLQLYRDHLPADGEAKEDAARGTSRPLTLAPEQVNALRRLGREWGATLFMTLATGYAAVLARHSGQHEVAVGTPVAGRPLRETEDLVGCFINTVVLRLPADGRRSFADLLAATREVSLDAFAHQAAPFERVVERLRPERSGGSPLFQALLVLQNTPSTPPALAGVEVARAPSPRASAKLDVVLDLEETPDGGLAGELEYRAAPWDGTTMERLLRRFEGLLTAAAADPERPVSELPWMDAVERHQLLHEWAGAVRSTVPPGTHETLHGRFLDVARLRPDAVAVSAGGQSFTYGELARRSAALAEALVRRGVRPEERVGLCLDLTRDGFAQALVLPLAILGVLRSGAAYLPVDAQHPAGRRADALADAGVRWVVSDAATAAERPDLAGDGRGVVLIDELPADGVAPATEMGSAGAAYVLYTSGSTGRPKGVVVEHRQVLRLFDTCSFKLGEDDVWTLLHAYTFDVSVWELWGTWLSGARLVPVPRWLAQSPKALHDLLIDERVTAFGQTPSAFKLLSATASERTGGRPADGLALRQISLGGEALAPSSLRAWAPGRGSGPVLLDLYGPTETTVHATWKVLGRTELASTRSIIGRPVADLTLRVVDPVTFQPSPVGIAGELLIGGPALARGYLRRPALTAERFVPDPFRERPGERLYRTGDLTRFLPDGDLEFFGRIDHQVKIRGHRVELGEIEAAILAMAEVGEAAVLTRQGPGGLQLVAFVAPRDPAGTIDVEALRHRLTRNLPGVMVPALFVPLGTLPKNASDKLDRKALAALETRALSSGASYRAPSGEAETTLAAVWRQVLGLDRVGAEDNFFELGGHSLLIPELQRAVEKVLGREVPLVRLLENPTVASQARALADSADDPLNAESARRESRRESDDRAGQRRQVLEQQRRAALRLRQRRETETA
jgi:amino acid adenylation domain-containing protein